MYLILIDNIKTNKNFVFIIALKIFLCFIVSLLLYNLNYITKLHSIMKDKLIIQPLKENNKNLQKSSMNKVIKSENNRINNVDNCYSSPENKNIKIIHIISTRFLLKPQKWNKNNQDSKIYNEKYIKNGLRVMKTYLIPSLDNQMCKRFIWILTLGEKANLTYLKSSLDLNHSFKIIIIYEKFFKEYVKNLSKGFDVLITTRMDYDDRIYYDAVNDVRKAININKPILIYGYLRGVYYFEVENKYYEYYRKFNNEGAIGIFLSLITILNKINDTYIINDLGVHTLVKSNLLKSYKKYGIKEINYDPAIFDSGAEKFVYIRQKYSNDYNRSVLAKKRAKEYNFNLNKFYGK